MAKKKTEEEEPVLQVTPTEEVTGFENIEQALVKQNVTQAVLTAMKEEFMILQVHGLDDKEGYKLVDEKRKLCKKTRVLAKEICEKGRAHAIAEQKAWINKQKEVVDQITEVEEYLESQLKAVDDEKKRIKEEQDRIEQTRIQNRTVRLLELGMKLIGDNYVLNGHVINTLHVRIYDDFTWAGVLAPVITEAEEIQAAKDAEEAEFKRIQEEQAAERKKLDEERAAFEAAQKKAKEEEDARLAKIAADKAALEEQENNLKLLKLKARTGVLYGLGMAFDGTNFVFGAGAVGVLKESLTDLSDIEFEALVAGITPKINACKAQIEKERLAEIEAEKAKAVAEAEAKIKAEAEVKAREEARRKNEEEIARQMEEAAAIKAAALKPDEEKLGAFLHTLQNLPVPEFTSPPYAEYSQFIKTTMAQVTAHLSNKRPK